MTSQKPWTPPEGMVECEVGPVVMIPVLTDVLSNTWELKPHRLVGHRPGFSFTSFESFFYGPVPVYRPCDEKGAWVS